MGYKRKLSSAYIPNNLNNNNNGSNHKLSNGDGPNGGLNRSTTSNNHHNSNLSLNKSNGDRKPSLSQTQQQQRVANGSIGGSGSVGTVRGGSGNGSGGSGSHQTAPSYNYSHSNHVSTSLTGQVVGGGGSSLAENKSDDANLSIPHIADFYPEGKLFVWTRGEECIFNF